MLVLTRRIGESIIIGNGIKITVVNVGPGRVKIGIEAPPSVRVDREEIHDRVVKEVAEEQAADVLHALAANVAPADQATIVTGPDTSVLHSNTSEQPATPAASSSFRLSNFRRKPR